MRKCHPAALGSNLALIGIFSNPQSTSRLVGWYSEVLPTTTGHQQKDRSDFILRESLPSDETKHQAR